jgi:flagellar protein FliT
MNPTAEYFVRYEAIVAISARMLAAARRASWHELTGLQDEYRTLIDGLQHAGDPVSLDDAGRARKYELIRRILADDAAIRDLESPSMARLSARLAAGRSTRLLKELYGAR